MNKTFTTPKTLQEAMALFSDADRCFDFAMSMRWPDGKVTCPRCGSAEHSFLSTRRIWFCKGCKKQFTMKVGTIFEDSPLGMDKWMLALWLIVNCKNGISSCEVARDLGITQKSAWFMMHRLRLAMQTGSFQKMSGEIEIDETFVGGKSRNMHLSKRRVKITGTGFKDKTAILGFLRRGGEIRAEIVPNTKRKALMPHIERHVEEGSAVYTDALASYEGLAEKYGHEVIDHAIAYVRGHVHTNGLENFWSLLKRTIRGTYVSVEPFHLDRYLDEQMFRFNNRLDKNDGQRFMDVMGQVAGRRLTFNQLTGKQDTPRQIN